MDKKNEPYYITTHKNEIIDISEYDLNQILRLHYDEELAFADLILKTEPFSQERSDIMKIGYETITKICVQRFNVKGEKIVSWGGITKHNINLVKKIIIKVVKQKGNCLFFEAGVGTGAVITPISKMENVTVIGCDVYVDKNFIDPSLNVYKGSLYDVLDKLADNSIDVFYWNAVMEHVPEDEIEAVIKKIAAKLAVGGIIINITPNKAKGPTNITAYFEPRGSKSKGFHFYEYSFEELITLFRKYDIESDIGFLGYLAKGIYILGSTKIIDRFKLFLEKAVMILPWFVRSRIIRWLGCDVSVFRKIKKD